MTTRERKERKLEKRRTWTESRQEKAKLAFQSADTISSGIPLGQPILVGHHSEGRHRRALKRIQSSMSSGVEHSEMARHHQEKAKGIERQLNTSIFSDDTDAIECLQDKLDGLIIDRDRMKMVNTWFRKNKKRFELFSLIGICENSPPSTNEKIKNIMVAAIKELGLTKKEQNQLFDALSFNRRIGFPPYALANLSGNIKRTRDRLAELKEKG